MPKRGKHEFDQQTRDAAITAWHRDNPGNENVKLQVDHKVPVWYAKREGLPPTDVNTLQNARAMPANEHKKRNHQDEEEITGFLSGMARFVGRLL